MPSCHKWHIFWYHKGCQSEGWLWGAYDPFLGSWSIKLVKFLIVVANIIAISMFMLKIQRIIPSSIWFKRFMCYWGPKVKIKVPWSIIHFEFREYFNHFLYILFLLSQTWVNTFRCFSSQGELLIQCTCVLVTIILT